MALARSLSAPGRRKGTAAASASSRSPYPHSLASPQAKGAMQARRHAKRSRHTPPSLCLAPVTASRLRTSAAIAAAYLLAARERARENLDAAMMTVGVFSSRRLSAASRRRSKEDFAGRNTPRQACGSLQLRPVLPGCRSDALLPAPSLGRISSSGSGSCLLAFCSSRGRGCSFAPSPPSLGIWRLRVLLREHLRAPSSTQAAPPPPVTSPRSSP